MIEPSRWYINDKRQRKTFIVDTQEVTTRDVRAYTSVECNAWLADQAVVWTKLIKDAGISSNDGCRRSPHPEEMATG